MLLSILSQPSRRKNHPKRTLYLQCDVCGHKYTKLYVAHVEKAQHHACSIECQAKAQLKGGTLDLKKRQVFIERYGAENPQQVPEFKKKARLTNLDRYGVEVGSQADVVKERARQTNQERYGVDWHTQSTNFATKTTTTWLANYGVCHPMKSDKVKAKYDFKGIWKKAHETKKQNGSYANSAGEKRFHQRLLKLFTTVQHQIPIEHVTGVWFIDFKVGNIYVQFDGAYWHGLDRPMSIIKLHKTPRDAAIHTAWLRDRTQDEWFTLHNLKLIRITDKQEKKLTDTELVKLFTLQ